MYDCRLEFNDGRKNFFIENILANLSCRGVAHEARDRVFLFEINIQPSQRSSHFLNLPESHTDRRASEFNGKPAIIGTDAVGHVIGLDFLGSATMHTGAFVRNNWIRKGAANDARPGQFLFGDGRGGTDIGFGIEPPAHPFADLSNGANHRGIEVFCAHPSETGVTLHTLVLIDRRAVSNRIDMNGAHRANGYTISTGDAFFGVDQHRTKTRLLREIRVKLMAQRLASSSEQGKSS